MHNDGSFEFTELIRPKVFQNLNWLIQKDKLPTNRPLLVIQTKI